MSDSTPDSAAPRADVAALSTLAQELLAEARESSSGRAALTVVTGPVLRATVIALVARAEMAEHDSPPAATLQALVGDVQLRSADQEWVLRAGDVISIPPFRHSLLATSDAVVLLTVALH